MFSGLEKSSKSVTGRIFRTDAILSMVSADGNRSRASMSPMYEVLIPMASASFS